MLITIFTPTYNRAHLLPRLYESLCKQSVLDTDLSPFEWLIVDDGSVDNTEEVVQGFIAEQTIPIRYFKKPNGGKHTAINLGAKEAEGELFWILDSDDSLPTNAVETVIRCWGTDINIAADPIGKISKTETAGICGYMAHHDGTIIGIPVVEKPIYASSLDLRYKLHITGDMMEVFRTEVMREFPFPEIIGERFCSEALVWNRIAAKYKLFLIPDIIYYRDYLDGGLTDNIVRIRMKSPIAAMMTYAELFVAKTDNNTLLPFATRLKAAINYWRFAFCAKERNVKIASWGKLLMPLGWLMHIADKRKVN